MPRWLSPNPRSADPPETLTLAEMAAILLPLARAAIASRLGAAYRDSDLQPGPAPWLQRQGASFVTLHTDGRLHGCIGTVEAYQPLHTDVVHNARAAALRDRRFPALVADELERTSIEVSVLSALQELTFTDESQALAQLRPGVDGVVLRCGGRRAVFLPQVWAGLPEPEDFLGQLKLKAGLPQQFWSPTLTLHRFTVREVHEGGGRAS